MSVSIVLDQDPRFTTHFKNSFQRAIQVLEDMLWACVLDLKGGWKEHLPLVEFAYNNSYQASIQMTPYGDLYGRRWERDPPRVRI